MSILKNSFKKIWSKAKQNKTKTIVCNYIYNYSSSTLKLSYNQNVKKECYIKTHYMLKFKFVIRKAFSFTCVLWWLMWKSN